MNQKLKAILITALIATLIIGAVVYAAHYLTITNTGNVQTVATLTSSVSSFDWGTMAPSESKTLTADLTNIGGTATGNLIVSSTQGALGTLSSNATGTSILSGATVTASFTLQISGSATGQSFSFDITISD